MDIPKVHCIRSLIAFDLDQDLRIILLGVFYSLTGISALRVMQIAEIADKDVAEIQQLTQLCELTAGYFCSPLSLKVLRQKLPFVAVYRY